MKILLLDLFLSSDWYFRKPQTLSTLSKPVRLSSWIGPGIYRRRLSDSLRIPTNPRSSSGVEGPSRILTVSPSSGPVSVLGPTFHPETVSDPSSESLHFHCRSGISRGRVFVSVCRCLTLVPVTWCTSRPTDPNVSDESYVLTYRSDTDDRTKSGTRGQGRGTV